MRDDFAAAVKAMIAARAGHRCSNPNCKAPTSGPQLDQSRALNLGVAAHITGASLGGPRYDAAIDTEERNGIDNAIWLCQNCAKLIDNDPERFTVQLLHQWRNRAEREAFQAIGKSPAGHDQVVSREVEIERDLKLRDQLYKELLLPPDKRRVRPPTHPYEKFRRSKIVVRGLDDVTYPEMDEGSQWFRAEPFDFYHRGLELIITIEYAYLDSEGRWFLESEWRRGEPVPEGYQRIKVWVIGQLPYRTIRAVDTQGDEYYQGPQLFCSFQFDGWAYENVRYAICGDEYDWPLSEEQHVDPSSVGHGG